MIVVKEKQSLTFLGKYQLSKLSIAKIRHLVEAIEPDDTVIALLAGDRRAGVRSLAATLVRRREKQERRQKRQEELCALESDLRTQGKSVIAGVDEAGRGPLAGPVVAAAVVLPEDIDLLGIDDSKKLTAARREVLFEAITSRAVAWGIGMVDNEEIDNTNILEAAMKAMCTAVRIMKLKPDVLLVDGPRTPGADCDERAVVDGDARCRVIAAASIIAKVTRDRIMIELDSVYPGYGFAGHKGYGARSHIDAIGRLGPCDIHRISFRIVPAVSPEGTAAEVLKKRLVNAPSLRAFESNVAGIARMKEHLKAYDVEMLRDVYRSCSKRFMR